VEPINIIAAVPGGIALVFSLVSAYFAHHSVAQARRSVQISGRALHAAANQYASDLVIRAGRVFIEYPALRPYFFDGKRPAANHWNQAEAVALSQLDVMEAIWDHHDEFKDLDCEAWREWTHAILQSSPTIQETYDPDWYPSLKLMLAEAVCTKPMKHEWAFSRAALPARQELEKALGALARDRNELAGSNDERAPRGQYPTDLPDAGVLVKDSGQTKQPAVSTDRQKELLADVARLQLRLGRSDRAVVLAAAWPWPERPRGPAQRKLRLKLAHLWAMLPWRLRGPRLPDDLRHLLDGVKYSSEMEQGRRMSLHDAAVYAVRDD
jgi:hypothetical protein